MVGYNLDEKTGFLGLFSSKLSIAKILKFGETIDLKHYNMYDFIKATIVGVDDPHIRLFIENMPQIEIFPEDYMVLNYSGSGELYVMSSKIDSIAGLSPADIMVTVLKIEKMKDLRKYERFYVSLSSYMKVPGILEPVFGVVTNISPGGIKLNCNMDLMMEDIIDITINLEKTEKVNFKGKVVRKNKLLSFFEYGFELFEITDGNRRNLVHFINKFHFGI